MGYEGLLRVLVLGSQLGRRLRDRTVEIHSVVVVGDDEAVVEITTIAAQLGSRHQKKFQLKILQGLWLEGFYGSHHQTPKYYPKGRICYFRSPTCTLV